MTADQAKQALNKKKFIRYVNYHPNDFKSLSRLYIYKRDALEDNFKGSTTCEIEFEIEVEDDECREICGYSRKLGEGDL